MTQLWYARQGIITPEMEYIAIRENQGIDRLRCDDKSARNTLTHQHSREASPEFIPSIFGRFPQRIPKVITPEFVRDEVAAGRAIIPATSTTRKTNR